MTVDIAVVGAGPVGLAFACGFANTNIKVVIIDKLPKNVLARPGKDGRDIALTHQSAQILKKIGVWDYISLRSISEIKQAIVQDGYSSYCLDFNCHDIQKKCLGYLISNHLIRKNLYKRLKKISNVTIINNVECESIITNSHCASISLSNGTTMKASLVVAADGRFSKTRSMLAIPTFSHDFKKNMLVCRMQHEKTHNNIAYELFHYTQTQALLPLKNKQSSIVLTVPKDIALTLMKVHKKKFNKEMQNNFNNRFGKMTLIGERYSYPMITIYAKKFTTNRFALIGDAAVGMHPVTAHGFNLGLKGQEILVKEIKFAIERNIDIGLPIILQNYQLKMHCVAAPLYFTTNSIVNLFTRTSFPAKIIRKFLLRLTNVIKPVKHIFLHVLK